MAYQKQTWGNGPAAGTPLSADRLAHLEDGIGGVADTVDALAGTVTAIDARTGAATATASGIVELATSAEAVAGTDTVRAVTPQGAKALVVASPLNTLAAPTAAVPFGSQKVTLLATPTAASDAATKGYVDTAVAGNLSGANELAYAEKLSDTTVAAGTGTVDITGLTFSFVMPNRPVWLEFGCIFQCVSGTAAGGTFSFVETTAGGAGVALREIHGGQSNNTGEYKDVVGRKRITGTAGVTRTFKMVAHNRTVSWTILGGSTWPAYITAYAC